MVTQIDRAAWPCFAPYLPTPVGRRGKLVVFGCGSGDVLAELVENEPRLRSFDLVGVDIDPGSIDQARERFGSLAAFEVGDVRDLGERQPSTYDAIYCHGVFDHCSAHRRVLASAREALRPGGAFFYVTPDRNLSTWLRFVAIGPRYVFGLGHYAALHDYRRFPRPSELDALARDVGFVVEADPEDETRAYHRGLDYRAHPLAIAAAVRRRDATRLGFEITPPRWWLRGGFSGEYLGVLRRP